MYQGQPENNITFYGEWFHSIAMFFCFFSDVLERMQHNVSVSMAECQIREGGTELCWNVTAPCRLQAEVWLCKNDLAGGQCEEVTGSRQWVHDHSGWSATRAGHWVTIKNFAFFSGCQIFSGQK